MSTHEGSPIDWENWQAEIPATLMFIVKNGQILLIEKLTGIGQGKINGPGGKIDPGESAEQAVIRECQEELHITPHDPVKMGELHFAMSDIPDIHCHVYMAESFDGEPTATREANPLWTSITEIPFDLMWADDRHWLPQMLDGQKFNGRFKFEEQDVIWKDVQFGESASELWIGCPLELAK
ncbi:8-oxo-dGTP diphosphatase [Rubritalea sp.]|uniref:8-oxo-dGTP diphosphatase n=1 Tax=Rubritalea sp. TaxID=2109375 RepID=UPI003EF3986A